MKRWILLTLLLMVLGIGSGFRLYKLGEKSLWSDEIATIATSLGNSIDPVAYTLQGRAFDPPEPVPAMVYREKATHSHGAGNLAQTAEVLKLNVHPPLFFWVMNIWIHTFGLSPESLRLPAALLGILSIAAIYWLALKIADLNQASFSPTARQGFALLAAAMMAFSAYQVDHAQDARQYTLLMVVAMFSVGMAIALVKCLELPGQLKSFWPWLGLGLVLTAGLYTQYFFAGFAGFVFLYLAWQGRRNKRFLLNIALMGLLVAALMLPWWSIFKEQLVFLKSAGHYTAGLWKPLQLPEKLWRIACEFFLPEHALGKFIPLLIGLVVASVFLRTERKESADHRSARTLLSAGLGLILLWLLAVVGGQVVIDLLKNSHTATIRRYLLLASPACYLLMSYGLVMIGHRLKTKIGWAVSIGLSVLLLGLMVQDTLHLLRNEHTSSDEFKQAAEWIHQLHQPNDIVLVSKSGAMAVGMAYYLRPDIRMRGLDIPEYRLLQSGSSLMRQLNGMLLKNPHSRIWLVLSHEAPSTRVGLHQWLTEQGFQEKRFEKFPGVRLILWRRE